MDVYGCERHHLFPDCRRSILTHDCVRVPTHVVSIARKIAKYSNKLSTTHPPTTTERNGGTPFRRSVPFRSVPFRTERNGTERGKSQILWNGTERNGTERGTLERNGTERWNGGNPDIYAHW